MIKTPEEILLEHGISKDGIHIHSNLNRLYHEIIKAIESYHAQYDGECQIDFDGNVLAHLKVVDGKIQVIKSMNGWGDPIEPNKIKITEL